MKRITRREALSLAGLTGIAMLVGCGKKEAAKPAAGSAAAGAAAAGKTVSTDGSTSMEKLIGVLKETYAKDHADITISYSPTGSGSGIKAVQEGRCDIGLSSRALKDAEKEAGLVETVVAKDGIAIVVHPSNGVKDLTIKQLADIYTGKITDWSQIGGKKAPIVLIGREAGSGTRDGFESITGTKGKCKYREELTSTGDVIATTARNENAIGYASLDAVEGKNNVKALTIEGVVPSAASVKDGSYKVQRPFVFVTKKDKKLPEAAQAFFDYVTGGKAADVISKAGVVPVK
ncbi:MAG: phosphate ABC transporter substrate-binding protein [Sutterellaceae bacterium]|nr:phosphate ABC transporter substrate-binding protein [Sutterellaceae bacterium]MDD7441442.1 phosphate ABC transporter substrate-binding protein [Sutterellaceae bacterium]MDY2868248.1 phosphate ABC transporter substrate-binding protein [Mesosutterella sp.]